jgi:catechol 2,3-dioxygenase-like lactoylglutathione lyase family enzyme
MPDALAGGDLAHAWHGFNHVSLVTPDLEATLAFYRDLLAMRVIFEGPGNPQHGPDALISVGGTGLGLHFFEVPNAEIFRYPTGVPSKLEFIAGALQHIAITIADEAAALSLRERLQAHGVPMTPIISPSRRMPTVRMFLFPDPSGMLLKATWLQPDAG